MRIGHVTNPAEDILEQLKNIKSIGFDYAEISFDAPYGLYGNIEKDRDEINKLLNNWNGFCLGHAPVSSDLSSFFGKVRRAWVDEIKNLMDIGEKISMKNITIHFDRHDMSFMTEKNEESVENFCKSLKELMDYSDVNIVLENIFNPAGWVEFYYPLFDKLPDLRANIDVGHAFVEGGMELVEKMLVDMDERINHIHFADNLGMDDDHFEIGKGEIDWKKVADLIKKIKYNETVTLEIFEVPENEDLTEARERSLEKIRGFFDG